MPSPARELDIVLFGATGMTGAYVVEELHRSSEGLRWGIAGRCVEKLRKTLREAATNLDLQEGALSGVPVIVADVTDAASLLSMAQRTRLVLNMVGPYGFFGRQVVEACVHSGTHHIDASAETQYMEQMRAEFDEGAREKGILVVSACGWGSICAETCLSFIRKHFQGDLERVESFVILKPGPLGMKINFGTFHSLIYWAAQRSQFRKLAKDFGEMGFARTFPSDHSCLARRCILFWSEVAEGWCLPLPGSDRFLMHQSERFRHQQCGTKPVQVHTYVRVPGFFTGVGILLWAVLCVLLSQFSGGQRLLERFPGFFSAGMVKRGGPTKEQVLGCSFTMYMRGSGWRQKEPHISGRHEGEMSDAMTLRLDGPEPAYLTTAMSMVQVALVVLKEKDTMNVRGGVLSPGVVFDGTSFIERVQQRGFHLTLVGNEQWAITKPAPDAFADSDLRLRVAQPRVIS